MTVHAYSIYTASDMLGRDRRTLTRLSRHTEPYSNVAGKAKYLLSTFVDLIEAEAKGDSGGKSLSDARARKEIALAEIAERQNTTEKGEWVLFDDVVKACREQNLVAREILLVLIGQIGSLLGPEAEGAAQDAVYDALNELANPFSDKQRKAYRAMGPIFDRKEFNEKEFEEDKKCFDEARKRGLTMEQAAEHVLAERRRADDKAKR
jgi:hypothetical protein